jgi:lysophospholipase L1-like esterase
MGCLAAAALAAVASCRVRGDAVESGSDQRAAGASEKMAHLTWATPAAAPAPDPPPEPVEVSPRPVYPPYAGHPEDTQPLHEPIENVERLDYYFGQLTLTELQVPGAVTRASQWGDSVIGGDGLTARVRELLQSRFGDAGHGFHALSRYSVGYRHRGVRFQDRGWDSCHIIFHCRPDQRYGYGGVSTRSPGGARSTWQTAPEGVGQRVSRFELWYAKHPEGGKFQLSVDGRRVHTVDTRSNVSLDAVETLLLPDGPHEITVAALGSGMARAYGVVLERDQPGVVWDELSQIGSFTQRLDYQDPEHIAAQVARRDTDLLVFIMGGNDVQRGGSDLRRDTLKYEREYSRVLRKFRAGKARASCLIMSLTDHGERVGGSVRSREIMPRLVAAQRRVASSEGCAFFDTFHAMGGEGSVGRWQATRPPLAAKDLIHPSPAGQRQLAAWLYQALMHGYVAFRERSVGQALPELDTARPLPGDATIEPVADATGSAGRPLREAINTPELQAMDPMRSL